jgi:hypothetical protein
MKCRCLGVKGFSFFCYGSLYTPVLTGPFGTLFQQGRNRTGEQTPNWLRGQALIENLGIIFKRLAALGVLPVAYATQGISRYLGHRKICFQLPRPPHKTSKGMNMDGHLGFDDIGQDAAEVFIDSRPK